jgi:hypothetical protein
MIKYIQQRTHYQINESLKYKLPNTPTKLTNPVTKENKQHDKNGSDSHICVYWIREKLTKRLQYINIRITFRTTNTVL